MLWNALPSPLPSPLPSSLRAQRLPGRRGWVAGLVVLALHGAVLLLAAPSTGWRAQEADPPTQAPLLLWLLSSPPPAAKPGPRAAAPLPAPRAPKAPQQAQKQAQKQAQLNAQLNTQPQAISLPQTTAAAASDPASTAQQDPTSKPPEAAASGASGGSRPAPALNLRLPLAPTAAWRQRNPALDDTRANTKVPTNMATLIERALGGDPHGPITEEALADGSVRFRRGRSCVIARPNRSQTIDPFNSSFSAKPRLLDSC